MYEKNINCINNDNLKQSLSRLDLEECKAGLSYCTTPSNHYVLLKNGIAIDDLKNPVEAAKKILTKSIKNPMGKNDIIIIFGLGVGYLLDEAFNTYSSRIIVYEPDIKVLKFVLSTVDISEHLASGRVYIATSTTEVTEKLSEMYLTNDKVEIIYLPNYVLVKHQDLILLTQKVYETCKSKIIDINTITRYTKGWMQNTISNIAEINRKKVYKLSDLEGKFVNQTALIAAAGPSLNENIENIKKNRERFIIFAVNKAVKYLIKNDVIPDFIVCLDSKYIDVTLNDVSKQLNHTNCIMDIKSDNSIIKNDFNKIFITFSENDSLMKKLAEYNEGIKFYGTGGSASTLALVSAVKMGFSKIIFSGLDLAFKENEVYADGQTLSRISLDKVMIGNEQQNIVQVKSVTGGLVYTREDYQNFIHHFEVLINNMNYNEIYNTTTFGAYIEGIKNESFDKLTFPVKADRNLVASSKPFRIDIKDFIDDETICFNNVISELSKGSPAHVLASAIVKSALLYQYMQAEILDILKKDCNVSETEEFVAKTKDTVRTVVELLKKYKLN